MTSVTATYFDGRAARAHAVTLALAGDRLVVTGAEIRRDAPLSDLHVSEPMGAAPRWVKFPDGAHCEVRDHAGFAALLSESGHHDGVVVRLQRRWGWALMAIAITVASVAAGYRWGLPAFSTWLAFKTPDALVAQLGGSTLTLLDESVFTPSALPASRQQALNARFVALANADRRTPVFRVLYRDGGDLGANAFALPDGSIVVTDRLVELADDDSEILAVLAHELGHVEHRHGLRMLIQSSIVGIVVAWYMGDVGSLAAGLPTLLLEAGYSRDHEREADLYAARLLNRNGLSPGHLADMLAKLEADHGGGSGRVTAYLASHPATQERIDALRTPSSDTHAP